MYTFDWLAHQARLRPTKTALVDVASDRHITYQQLNERAGGLAAFMQATWGLRSGDRVAILAYNGAEYVEALYACGKIGAILVCLNWRLTTSELAYIVADSEPRAIIYDDAFASPVTALRTQFEIPHRLVLGPAYEAAVSAEAPVVMAPVSLNAPWYILYTSGTTGRPKGVIQTFGMVLYNRLNIGDAVSLTEADTTLNVLPFFHTGGLNLYTNPSLLLGATALIQRVFDPAETLRLLAGETSLFFGVPAIYQLLSEHPDFDTTDLSRVRSWACGGAPMPLNLLANYAKRGLTVRQGFGMTETGPTVFLLDEANAGRKAGSVGKPQLYVDVRIVDREGREVAPGESGELLVKGPGVTPGYWQLPEVTREAITDDGWLHTGDVARVDEEGYYYIVDRWKDMFISGGENVFPAEVERVLQAHPAVAEAAVVGVPDPKWGEVGLAFVVLAPGTDASAASILTFCDGKLARFKIPRQVKIVSNLPYTAAGKVRKAELRSLLGID